MHYSRLIKMPGVIPAIDSIPEEVSPDGLEELRADLSQTPNDQNVMPVITSIPESNPDTNLDYVMKEMKNNEPTPAPEGYDDTILNDEEISEVMSTLYTFHKKYFPDIPMEDELDPRFMWNIPLEIYKAHINVKEYGWMDDIFDPLILCYLFTTRYPEEAYSKFLLTLYQRIRDNEKIYTDLVESAEDYMDWIRDVEDEEGDDTPDDDEESPDEEETNDDSEEEYAGIDSSSTEDDPPAKPPQNQTGTDHPQMNAVVHSINYGGDDNVK